MSFKIRGLVLLMAIVVGLTAPCIAVADSISNASCTTTATFFETTVTPADPQLTLDLSSPFPIPGAECAVVNITNLALMGGPFAFGLVAPGGNPGGLEPDLSDVITLGNNAMGQLQVCAESAPYSGNTSTIDCPMLAPYQLLNELPTVSIGVFSTVGDSPAFSITWTTDEPSDIIEITAIPERSLLVPFVAAVALIFWAHKRRTRAAAQ